MGKQHLTPQQRKIVLNLFNEFNIHPDRKVEFGGSKISELNLAEWMTATQGFGFYLKRFAEDTTNERLFEDFASR